MRRSLERERQALFTKEYLQSPWVILNRVDNSAYLGGIEDLKGKLVVVEKGYLIGDKLRADVPDIRLFEAVNTRAALEMLAAGRGDAYVGNLTQSTLSLIHI